MTTNNKRWPNGRFPKRGEDPEFDKLRDAQAKKNRDEGVAVKVNRTKLWRDTMNKTLAENPELGTDLINRLIKIMNNTESERTQMECIKMLSEMTGIKAPAAAVQEEIQEEGTRDVNEAAKRLGELGVTVSGLDRTGGEDDQ